MDQFYPLSTVAKAGSFIVGTDRSGTFYVYLLKRNGKTTFWGGHLVTSSGLNGFLASIGVRGAITRALLGHGLRFISSALPRSLASILIAKCLSITIRACRE